jgi:hypothetical protein
MGSSDPRVPHEQLVYARWLERATRTGFALLAIAFLLYALGIVEAYVPLAQLPALWVLPVEQYLAATGSPAGWGWLALAYKADYLNLAAIALLGLATVCCYVRMLILLLERGERLPAALAAAQLAVLVAAASGIFAAAH